MGFSSAMMSGVSGLLNNAEAIGVIGNNIANVNTVGFKSGRTLFADMLSVDGVGKDSEVGLGVTIKSIENQFTQGTLLPSPNVTDLAISGGGFFVVKDQSANPVTSYTRAGAFKVDVNHKYIVNPDDARLCDATGAPIDLSALADFSRIDKISPDGTISYFDSKGETKTSTIKVGVATFINPLGLEKAGGSLYRATITNDGSGAATISAADSSNKIFSYTLEDSNVDMATQMVNMITTQRAYSANSKSIITSDEMTKTVISLKR